MNYDTEEIFTKIYKLFRIGGELVVWRRPTPEMIVNYRDYVPCNHCLVFVTKSELWRHEKSCHLKKTDANQSNNVKQAELLLYPNRYNEGVSYELKNLVLSVMNNNDITAIVRKDNLVVTYGSFMFSTAGMRKVTNISQRMRVLSRLLISLRLKIKETERDLTSFIKPEHFDDVVSCTKDLGGFSYQTCEGESVASFSSPSLPLKIGYTLEKCCSLLKGIGIKKKNKPQLVTDSTNFLGII